MPIYTLRPNGTGTKKQGGLHTQWSIVGDGSDATNITLSANENSWAVANGSAPGSTEAIVRVRACMKSSAYGGDATVGSSYTFGAFILDGTASGNDANGVTYEGAYGSVYNQEYNAGVSWGATSLWNGPWYTKLPLGYAVFGGGGANLSRSWVWADVNALELDAYSSYGSTGNPTVLTDIWIEVETLGAPTATPGSLTPVTASTVTTSTPTLSATRPPSSVATAIEYQLATNSAFTTGAVTYITPYTAETQTVTSTYTLTTAQRIAQGTWYLRARVRDNAGQFGPWTSTNTITVAHAPSAAAVSPVSDSYLAYATTNYVNWSFSDTSVSDTQTAYQVIVERNDTGASVFDSGKITSTAQTGAVTISSTLKDIQLRWKVRLYDTDNVVGPYSSPALFRVGDPATVAITYPVNSGTADSGRPTVTWTFSASGGRTQASYRVVFRRTSDNYLIYDSGTTTGAALSFQPPQTILTNAVQYSVAVTTTDSSGIVTTTTSTFTTSYSAPPAVVYGVDVSGYDAPDTGYVRITWTGASPDNKFLSWRVYRRMVGEVNYTMLGEYGQATRSYSDWIASSGSGYEYVVTQTADRSGTVLESGLSNTAGVVVPTSTHYWLVNPNNQTDNLNLSNVTSDDYVDEYEQEVTTLIGRGRHVDYGTHLGKSGTLNAQLRTDQYYTARQKKIKLETLRSSQRTYMLRTPFGDIFKVALGNVSVSRVAGVGTSEYVNVSFTYMEVS